MLFGGPVSASSGVEAQAGSNRILMSSVHRFEPPEGKQIVRRLKPLGRSPFPDTASARDSAPEALCLSLTAPGAPKSRPSRWLASNEDLPPPDAPTTGTKFGRASAADNSLVAISRPRKKAASSFGQNTKSPCMISEAVVRALAPGQRKSGSGACGRTLAATLRRPRVHEVGRLSQLSAPELSALRGVSDGRRSPLRHGGVRCATCLSSRPAAGQRR